jgi:UDPglucose 6-dehydrogenase
MKLAVIGSGYVGLVAGACFSSTGNDVILVDIDQARVDMLRAGRLPIYEPGLQELVDRNVAEGRLSFTIDVAAAVAAAEVVVLAVGTPAAPDGSVDTRGLDLAAVQVAEGLRHYAVIVTKSTVPVGTCGRLTEMMSARTKIPFDYVANPEFLKEGAAVNDFLKPDRVIIGTTSQRAQTVMRHLYAPFMRRRERLLVMDPASAELTKYACNAMLAARISFMNEMASLCEHFGANVDLVRHGMGMDNRIGPEFLYPSMGYGGSCFPKDVKALISLGRQCGRPIEVVEAVHSVNRRQRERMFGVIAEHFGGDVHGRKLGVWGLAFKAGTDDVRESPAIDLVRAAAAAGAAIAVHDPKAMDTARAVLADLPVTWCRHMYDALDGADALVVCCEWPEYRTPDFVRMRRLLKQPVIFDGRNLYDLDWMRDLRFDYFSIGRPAVTAAQAPARNAE